MEPLCPISTAKVEIAIMTATKIMRARSALSSQLPSSMRADSSVAIRTAKIPYVLG